jgi:hemerythrin-like domain-containing protein
MPNALTLLKQDHKQVKELLEELESSTDRAAKRRLDLLRQINTELQVHAQIEEQIFYPAYHQAVSKKEDQKLFYEAVEEHKVVKAVLAELQGTEPTAPQFGAKAKVLKEMVLHHAQEEEKEMFKAARAHMSKEELDLLGEKLEARKQQLLGKRSNGRAERHAHT